MKKAKLAGLFVCVLLVVATASGCNPQAERVIVNSSDDVVRLIAQASDEAELAAQAARRAQQARELARVASTTDEMLAHLNQVTLEAQTAENAAKKAAGYAEDARRLAKAADPAYTTIDDLLARMRVVSMQSSIDTTTSNILKRGVSPTEGTDTLKARQALEEVAAASTCDVLVEVWKDPESVDRQKVLEIVVENSAGKIIGQTGVYDIISEEVLQEVYRIAANKPEDELKDLKDACAEVLSAR